MTPFKTAALAVSVTLPLFATMVRAEEKAKVKTTLETISPQLEPLRDLSPQRSQLRKTETPPPKPTSKVNKEAREDRKIQRMSKEIQ